MTEGYNDVPHKEVRWVTILPDGTTSTAVATVEYGIVKVSEELFDQMMEQLDFVKEVGSE